MRNKKISFFKTWLLPSLLLLGAIGIEISLLYDHYSRFDISLIAGTSAITTLASAFLLERSQRFFHTRNVFSVPNISLSALLTFFGYLLYRLFIHLFFDESHAIHQLSIEYFWIHLFTSYTFLIIVLATVWIDEQDTRAEKLRNFVTGKEREAMEIELNTLQEQFKPHFLFNSLNSINALTTINPEEARKMIQLLSDYMRVVVGKDKNEMISFETEIKNIKLYTDIEKIRFVDRLEIEYSVEKEAEKAALPALITQPLIENAIKYGLYGTTDTVKIELSANILNNELIIQVKNPFDLQDRGGMKGTGFGLRSIEKKLMYLYNRSQLMTTKEEENCFIVTLIIPQHA